MAKDSPFRVSWWYRTEFHSSDRMGRQKRLAEFSGHQLSRQYLGERPADRQVRRSRRRVSPLRIRNRKARSPRENRMQLRSKFFRRRRTTSRSPSSIGIRCRRTKIWACGAAFFCAPAEPYPCAIRRWKQNSICRGLDIAHLTVRAQLHNSSAAPVEGELRGLVGSAEISQPVTLAAGETKEIAFTPEQFGQLNFVHPRIWWPYTDGRAGYVRTASRIRYRRRALGQDRHQIRNRPNQLRR